MHILVLDEQLNISKHHQSAKEKIAARDFDSAIDLLKSAIKHNPNDLTAKVMLLPLTGRRGSIYEYRRLLKTVINQVRESILPSADIGRRLLTSIQYASSEEDKGSSILLLIDSTLKLLTEKPHDLNTQIFLIELYYVLGDYSSMIDGVERISKEKVSNARLESLKRITSKIKQPGYPNDEDPKLFGIGLSRTGTSSLNSALQKLSFHSVHWINPHTKDLIDQSDFYQFDAFTDITTSYNFETLYYKFPNSKFIYSTRPIKDWVSSMKRHHSNYREISSIKELNNDDNKERFRGKAAPIAHELFTRFNDWEDAYHAFDNRVQEFFGIRDEKRLLKIKICEGHGWAQLCDFVSKPVPKMPFPESNQTPHHLKTREVE